MNRFILILVVLVPGLTGCLGSTYILGDWQSGQIIDQRYYSAVAPTIPPHGDGVWSRTSESLESDDLFLRDKWFYEPGKFVIYKAAIKVVDTRSTMKSAVELKNHVDGGGLEGVRFSNSVEVKTSQSNLLCVRPPLYSEVSPKEGSGHFVYIMACVDTRTKIHYELFVVEDLVNEDKTAPEPSDGLNVGAARFFADFWVK